MSTKSTILHNNEPDNFHLFHECFDYENVYLELVNPEFFEIKNWQGKTYVTLAISGRLWNKFVRNGELKNWSGEDFDSPKTPEERTKEIQENNDEFFSWLKDLKNVKEDIKRLNKSQKDYKNKKGIIGND